MQGTLNGGTAASASKQQHDLLIEDSYGHSSLPPWQYECATSVPPAAILFVPERAVPNTRMRRRRVQSPELHVGVMCSRSVHRLVGVADDRKPIAAAHTMGVWNRLQQKVRIYSMGLSHE